jgi:hypothetical protein
MVVNVVAAVAEIALKMTKAPALPFLEVPGLS